MVKFFHPKALLFLLDDGRHEGFANVFCFMLLGISCPKMERGGTDGLPEVGSCSQHQISWPCQEGV